MPTGHGATSTRRRALVLPLATSALLAACGAGPTPAELDADNPIRPIAPAPFGMEEFFAEAAPQPTPARARLGRWLFYDARLSADGTVSCATCHRPEHAFSEPAPVSTGVYGRRGRRKAPSLVNLGARTILPDLPEHEQGPMFFWDGRATSLEAQALVPIANPTEMGMDHQAMVTTLTAVAGYRPYFRESFGSDAITAERVASALADYVRTRRSGNSPFDRWSWAREGRALSEQAKLGHDLFSFKARCAVCHTGFNFSDGRFHNLGVGWDAATPTVADEGRALVTGAARDRGAFKTPGLREVSKHPPYMHDGSLATLHDVIEFYNRGGVKNPNLSGRIRPLGLAPEEIDALVAFLRSLEGEGYQDRAPTRFPR